MVANELVHLKHVDLGHLEDSLHSFVTENLTLVVGVLELVRLYVCPQLLDNLGARELIQSQSLDTYIY